MMDLSFYNSNCQFISDLQNWAELRVDLTEVPTNFRKNCEEPVCQFHLIHFCNQLKINNLKKLLEGSKEWRESCCSIRRFRETVSVLWAGLVSWLLEELLATIPGLTSKALWGFFLVYPDAGEGLSTFLWRSCRVFLQPLSRDAVQVETWTSPRLKGRHTKTGDYKPMIQKPRDFFWSFRECPVCHPQVGWLL